MINDVKVIETGLILLGLLMIAAVFWWYLNYWVYGYPLTYDSRKEQLLRMLKDVGILLAILVGFFLLVVLWLSLAGPEIHIR